MGKDLILLCLFHDQRCQHCNVPLVSNYEHSFVLLCGTGIATLQHTPHI